MDSNISELVKLGHERADELKASCGAVDVRSVAQLISDLASQLEVQYVRSNALAAENAGLIKYITQSCYVFDGEQHEISDAYICATDGAMPETPDTDAFLAEVRAQGVEMLISHLNEWMSGMDFTSDKRFEHSEFTQACDDFAAQLRKGVQS